MVVLLHGFDHANSYVHPCLYVPGLSPTYSANALTFIIFFYLSL